MTFAQPWKNCSPEGGLLRPNEIARFLGVSRTSVYRLISSGQLPKPISIGPRAVGMPKAWLESVVAARAAATLANEQ